jgi:hypothetical protein
MGFGRLVRRVEAERVAREDAESVCRLPQLAVYLAFARAEAECHLAIAEAKIAEMDEQARRRGRRVAGVVRVPGAGYSEPQPVHYPGRRGLDLHARAMALAGWSLTRIARTYGVQRPAVVKWLARRARPGGVAKRRPAYSWRQCSNCKAVGWFLMNTHRRAGGRVFCSASCYRNRGGKRAGEFAKGAARRHERERRRRQTAG